MYKRIITILASVIFACSRVISSLAGWSQTGGKWQYEADGKRVADGWVTDNQEIYYLDSEGYMKSGWMKLSDTWYFLNTIHDGTYGKALRGWHWIDGYCYFFEQDGKMLANTVTPDGYQVSESGAWKADGTLQYIEGKGIITVVQETKPKRSGGGGSGGGGSGSGGTRPGIPDGSYPGMPEKPELPEEPILPEEEKPIIPNAARQFSYTILYKDISTKETLHIMNGQENENALVPINYPDISSYMVCGGQKESFYLAADQMAVSIYYRQIQEASPSDAAKVSWNVYFVEQGNHSNEIFRMQAGKSQEGTELLVDFPERILGRDGYYYTALKESPYRIFLYGFGLQKYLIEFKKSGIPGKPDPDAPAIDKLKRWLELSRMADKKLTGTDAADGQLITGTMGESSERLKNLFSMVKNTKRHEIYLIARNHTPSSFVLGQMPDAGSISEMVMDSFQIGEDAYVILKVGFQRCFQESICTHSFTVNNDVAAGCLTSGNQTVVCDNCTYEVSVTVPPLGHKDVDLDDRCDVCYETVTGNETPEAVHYKIGDLQARQLGEKVYLFRCIDEDYEDSLNNKQKTALFLCEQVIRSDIDSTSQLHKTMSFGGNNNYKSSTVRSWLEANATDNLFATHKSYTGIAFAYMGATKKGDYEQFDGISLVARDKPFQLLEDNIFLLSVEESVKYREYLWKFNGSDVNNPESQYSAYSKGYWLRTPQYQEANGQFTYGAGVYMVDLADGYIHTVNAADKSIGLRPAITVLQGK